MDPPLQKHHFKVAPDALQKAFQTQKLGNLGHFQGRGPKFDALQYARG